MSEGSPSLLADAEVSSGSKEHADQLLHSCKE